MRCACQLEVRVVLIVVVNLMNFKLLVPSISRSVIKISVSTLCALWNTPCSFEPPAR